MSLSCENPPIRWRFTCPFHKFCYLQIITDFSPRSVFRPVLVKNVALLHPGLPTVPQCGAALFADRKQARADIARIKPDRADRRPIARPECAPGHRPRLSGRTGHGGASWGGDRAPGVESARSFRRSPPYMATDMAPGGNDLDRARLSRASRPNLTYRASSLVRTHLHQALVMDRKEKVMASSAYFARHFGLRNAPSRCCRTPISCIGPRPTGAPMPCWNTAS
jgi:hypothetical protein